MTPLLGIALFQRILAFSERDTRSFQSSFQGVDCYGFPQLEVYGIVGLIITRVEINRMALS